jgi:hypothetical protein
MKRNLLAKSSARERIVSHLVLLLLLLFLVLTAVLWGGTRLIQAALYEFAIPDLYWRAPAAAAVMTVYLGLWTVLNYRAAEAGQAEMPYDNLFNFTTEQVSERPIAHFWALRGSLAVKYTKRDLAGMPPRYEYLDPDGRPWQAARARDVEAIVIKEGSSDVYFKPVPEQHRYVEEGGKRYLADEGFGRIMTPRSGGSFLRVLLNVGHFVAWFLSLWLLLRFQWPHALGLAAALWLMMTFVMPSIFRSAIDAKPPPPPAQAER